MTCVQGKECIHTRELEPCKALARVTPARREAACIGAGWVAPHTRTGTCSAGVQETRLAAEGRQLCGNVFLEATHEARLLRIKTQEALLTRESTGRVGDNLA